MIKVNLVDDHKVVSHGLKFVLDGSKDIKVINVAQSGEQLQAQLITQLPDVIVMDYSFGTHGRDNTRNGLEISSEVLAKYPDIKILMLTMHSSPEIIVPVVEAGIHGYMLKSERDFDIATAITRLHSEGHYFSPEIAPQLALNIKRYRENHIDVTEREQQVLEVMFGGNSAKEIAEVLFISPKTVETHRKHLLEKFGAKNSLHLVYKALKMDYLKPPNRADRTG